MHPPARLSPPSRHRVALGVLVVVWGAQAIVTQALLLRESLVLLYGSEFAWGVVLFAWLLGIACGAALGGWVSESKIGRPHAAGGLVVVLLLLSVSACVELWIFRGARAWLGIGPGEFLPLPQTALAAVLFVSPASVLVGMAFPLACAVVGWAPPTTNGGSGGPCPTDERLPLLSFARVYALESAGSLIGGAAFSFWAVEHLSPIQTALLCGATTIAVSAGLMAMSSRTARDPSPKRQRGGLLPSAFLVLLAVGAVLGTLWGDTLNHWLIQRRWQTVGPGYELITAAESRYQNLALGRRAGQYTLYCDGQVAADFPDPYTFVPLAHFWMCEHPQPHRVLVLGGGAEGLLSEILRHPVVHVDYVEPDPRQIELVRPFLADADRDALDDPRVTVHAVDARHYVKTQQDQFDLVIARLPEPTSALRARFYTDEFYGELRRAMSPRAVLCLTAAAAPAELSPLSRTYLGSIRATLRRHFPDIVVGWGDPAQILAATEPGLITTDPAELTARYAQRGVQTDFFDPAWFTGANDWLAPAKIARRASDLDAAGAVDVSTDLRPAVYVQRLVLWEAATGRSHVIAWLRSLGLGPLIAALAALGVITLVAGRLRRGPRAGWAAGAVTLSVGTTGFATMALSILFLFAFQNLYGYVYQRIGWIVALFMGGLVVGCLWASPKAQRPDNAARHFGFWILGLGLRADETHRAWRALIFVDVLLALLALAVPLVLPVLNALPSSPGVLVLVETCISLMVVMAGLLGGAAFALAGRLQLGFIGRAGATAGSVVGADHAGACLGALLCGVLLVPVFGTVTAALLLAGMKLSSAATLALTRRSSPAA